MDPADRVTRRAAILRRRCDGCRQLEQELESSRRLVVAYRDDRDQLAALVVRYQASLNRAIAALGDAIGKLRA